MITPPRTAPPDRQARGYAALATRTGITTPVLFWLPTPRREAALRAHSEQALALCRATGDRVGQADALNKIGWLAAQLGEYQQALSCCEQALSLLRDLDRRYELAYVLDSLGYIHVLAGDQSRAIGCYRQAIGLFGEFGDRYEQSQTLTSLGDTYQAVSQPGKAEEAWRQALAILDDLGHPGARDVRARLSGRSPAPARTSSA